MDARKTLGSAVRQVPREIHSVSSALPPPRSAEQVYRDYFGDERIVDVHIRRLRTKIEADPGSPTLLVTVRGLGYRFDQR